MLGLGQAGPHESFMKRGSGRSRDRSNNGATVSREGEGKARFFSPAAAARRKLSVAKGIRPVPSGHGETDTKRREGASTSLRYLRGDESLAGGTGASVILLTLLAATLTAREPRALAADETINGMKYTSVKGKAAAPSISSRFTSAS